MKKIFIEYTDGNRIVRGNFELIKKTDSYVEIKSGSNILTIPFHKVNKIKEKLSDGYNQQLKGGKIKI